VQSILMRLSTYFLRIVTCKFWHKYGRNFYNYRHVTLNTENNCPNIQIWSLI
jgi:hypothetical protein